MQIEVDTGDYSSKDFAIKPIRKGAYVIYLQEGDSKGANETLDEFMENVQELFDERKHYELIL
jgi:hypothetical protein